MSTIDAHSRLLEFYNAKYSTTNLAEQVARVTPVPLVSHPKDRYEMAVALAAKGAAGAYLEISAGSGNCTLPLLNCYEQIAVTEFSDARVEQLRALFSRTHRKVEVLRNNIEAEDLPFAEDSLDTIVMIAVIEHLIEPISALRKICRLLKPGGRLILDTPNVAKWTRRIKLMAGYFPSTSSLDEGLLCYDRKSPTDLHDEGHLHYFTFRSLSRLCNERAGFTRTEAYGYGRTALSRAWPTMFSEISLIAYK